jgi:EpsI family protein
MNANGRKNRWMLAAVCALAGTAVFQFFGNATRGYIDTSSVFWWWGVQWFDAASETEHGVLILGVSAWLLWRNLRTVESGDRSSERADEGTKSALMALVLGLALHALGFAAQQTRVSIVGLLVFTWGVLRLGGGRRWGAAAVFPLGFLVFAIPLGALDTMGFWLRAWVIDASAALAHAAGIGVLQNGTQLIAPDGRYHYDVVAECSGVRSLTAMVALSVLLGYLNFKTWTRRGLLVLACLPFVYLGNVARITAIVFAAQWGGEVWGERVHAVMGYGVFAIVLGGVLLVAKAVQRWWPEGQVEDSGQGTEDRGERTGDREQNSEGGQRTRVAWMVAGVVVGLAAGEMAFLHGLATREGRGLAGVRLAVDMKSLVELPTFLGTEWIGRRAEVTAVEREILPPDTGFARKNYVAVANPARQVFLSVVLSGRDRTSIHRPELCLVGQGWTITGQMRHEFAYPKANRFPATVLRVRREVATPKGRVTVPQLTAYWFVSGDRVVATHWERLLYDAWNRVAHGRADRWAYVLLQTDATDGEAAALARMQAVLTEALPVFQWAHNAK